MSLKTVADSPFPESVARVRAALGDGAPRLAPALERLDWAMVLPSGAAPGFVYLAGACGGRAVGGGGVDLAEAAGRLAGEASEVLAQDQPVAHAKAPPHPALAAQWGDGPTMRATSLTFGRSVGAPLAAVFPTISAPDAAPPRSLGLAAGPDVAAARLAGLLELIERDAAAAWWNGSSRARALDVADIMADIADAAIDLAGLRTGAAPPERLTTLLALPAVGDVPVICALSRDAGGRGLAFGLKAALEPHAAMRGALCELLQMEIALEIARMRETQRRLTQGDAGPLARAALDPDAFEAFSPLPPVGRGPHLADLDALTAHLGKLGVEVIVADLIGLDGGLAVAKAFAPRLLPLPGPGPAPRPDAPGAWAALM